MVLVVEDDPAAASALQDALIHADCDVEVVGSAEAALKALRDRRFSLALVDLVLPGMDGRELLACMAEEPTWVQIPVIVVSGTQAALPHNAVAFLRKPVQPSELLDLVEHHARR
jgi:DNA-binding response OmpR family regulator